MLLSHDQHPDDLDGSGRALLADVALVLTTRSAAARLVGTARGLAPWETAELTRPDGGTVTVTATPARHGSEGCEPLTGEVVGSVLSAADLPTVHVSGDSRAHFTESRDDVVAASTAAGIADRLQLDRAGGTGPAARAVDGGTGASPSSPRSTPLPPGPSGQESRSGRRAPRALGPAHEGRHP